MATQERIPYWQKLQDPRWQRKRLEIMQRDEFHCQMCGDSESTLNVHHGYYAKNREPWEYPPESLWTLCDRCHSDIETALQGIREEIGKLIPEAVIELHKLIQNVSGCLEWGPDIGKVLFVRQLSEKRALSTHEMLREFDFITEVMQWFLREFISPFGDGEGI